MPERTNIAKAVRDAILSEAGYKCAVPVCGTTLAMDIHHIWEVSQGGGDDPDNLLALCPTHHALYHRGTISEASIRRWKIRLVALNSVGSNTIREILKELLTSKTSGERESSFDGFPLATSEFLARTCEIGALQDGPREMFFRTGFCCFIDHRLAITVPFAINAAENLAQRKNGSPAVHTLRGMAPYEVLEQHDNLVVIKMGEIDDQYLIDALRDRSPEIGQYMHEPLQTRVRFRIVPHVGETVGLLSLANEDDSIVSTLSRLRFETCSVSFLIRASEKMDFAQFALTPILGTLQYAGAPVFTEAGVLVGLVRDTVILPNELGVRPVVTNVIPLKSVLQSE